MSVSDPVRIVDEEGHPQGVTGNPVVVDGDVTATITGTGDVNLAEVGGASVALGTLVAATSIPVVIALDQPAFGVLDAGIGMNHEHFRTADIIAGLVPSGGAIFIVDLVITSDAAEVFTLDDGVTSLLIYVSAGVSQITPRAYFPPFGEANTVTLSAAGGANWSAFGSYREASL